MSAASGGRSRDQGDADGEEPAEDDEPERARAERGRGGCGRRARRGCGDVASRTYEGPAPGRPGQSVVGEGGARPLVGHDGTSAPTPASGGRAGRAPPASAGTTVPLAGHRTVAGCRRALGDDRSGAAIARVPLDAPFVRGVSRANDATANHRRGRPGDPLPHRRRDGRSRRHDRGYRLVDGRDHRSDDRRRPSPR